MTSTGTKTYQIVRGSVVLVTGRVHETLHPMLSVSIHIAWPLNPFCLHSPRRKWSGQFMPLRHDGKMAEFFAGDFRLTEEIAARCMTGEIRELMLDVLVGPKLESQPVAE